MANKPAQLLVAIVAAGFIEPRRIQLICSGHDAVQLLGDWPEPETQSAEARLPGAIQKAALDHLASAHPAERGGEDGK